MKPTIFITFLFVLLTSASCKPIQTRKHAELSIQQNPKEFPWNISKISFSIAQVEGIEMFAINGEPQHVPFGPQNSVWQAFKSLLKPGDEIHQWTNGDGGAPKGYCIVRNERVVAAFTTVALIE